MKKTTIEFATASAASISKAAPWASSKKTTYQDLLLKPELSELVIKFPVGTTWCRVLPAVAGSSSWMQGIKALNHARGRHTHPKTLDPAARSVYDLAYQWLSANEPSKLFSRANRGGVRLLTDPHCVCWILVEEVGIPKAHLLLAGAYDASRGGVPGLGYQLGTLISDCYVEGADSSDPLAPEAGLLVGIEKSLPSGAGYPSYRLRLGRQPAPIEEIIARMAPEEISVIRPIEECIRIPSEEEEWALLETLLDAGTVAKIRAAHP